MLGLSRERIKQHAAEIAEFSELGEYINMPVHTYSSGMVMRLMFSTATSFRCDRRCRLSRQSQSPP